MQNQDIDKEAAGFSLEVWLPIIKRYLIFLLKFSWVMVITGCLLGWYLRNRKLNTPTSYQADLTFKMDESSGAAQQGIASLFGGVVGVEGGQQLSITSIEEIIKTRLIIQKALFDKKKMHYNDNPKEDFVINHYLRKFVYAPTDTVTYFFENDIINPYNRKANRILLSAYSQIADNFLLVEITPAKIIHLKAISINEDFSYELLTSIYHQLDTFYSEDKVKQKEAFYDMAKKRTADLKEKMHIAESAYTNYLNKNGAEAAGVHNISVRVQYLATDLRSATEAYFMALRSQEAAWVALEKQKQSRALQIIDAPLYPLKANVPNPLLHMIFGFVAGGGLSMFVLIVIKFLLDKRSNNRLVTESEN